ncbi:MAG: hypothetical protein ABI045_04230 [Flavobacteriales bacterium]
MPKGINNSFEATKTYIIKPNDIKLKNKKFSLSSVPIYKVYKMEGQGLKNIDLGKDITEYVDNKNRER